MTETKRWIVDDAGTLIDIETREMYDIVEEVCPVLNALHEENTKLKIEIDTYKAGNKTIHERLKTLHEENQDLKTGTYINAKNTIKELKEENTHIKTTIQTMIKNERTQMGQSVLQQLWEQIQ